ncbi:MAG: hypothetical protein K8S54_04250 [Spirochaetia bacterium]|nr:hypothetical protein [Spirochaetia bacterium]
MQDENLGYLWHTFTWSEHIPGMLSVLCFAACFAIALAIWRYREIQEKRWGRLGGLAGLKRLSDPERSILETFYMGLPGEMQNIILNDRKRFWQLLFNFCRAQTSAHPREVIRLINKIFPVLKFQHPISTLEDIQPSEVIAVQIDKRNLIARVDRVDREHQKLDLRFPEKGFEIASPLPASLYFYRPGIGETTMGGSLEAAAPGHALFALQGNQIQVGAQPRLMARVEMPVLLSPISAKTEEDAEPHILKGRSGYISERAFMIVFSSETSYNEEEKHVERWRMDVAIPNSSIHLHVSGKILASKRPQYYIFRLDALTPSSSKILGSIIKQSAPEPEKII